MNKILNGLRTTVISAWEATHTLDIAQSSRKSLSLYNNRSAHIYPLLVSLMPMMHLLPFNLNLHNQAQVKSRHLPKLPTYHSSNKVSNNTPWLTTRRLKCEGLRSSSNSMLHIIIHKTSNCIKHRTARTQVHIWALSQAHNHSIRSRISQTSIKKSSSNKYQFIHSFNLIKWLSSSKCHSISTGSRPDKINNIFAKQWIPSSSRRSLTKAPIVAALILAR